MYTRFTFSSQPAIATGPTACKRAPTVTPLPSKAQSKCARKHTANAKAGECPGFDKVAVHRQNGRSSTSVMEPPVPCAPIQLGFGGMVENDEIEEVPPAGGHPVGSNNPSVAVEFHRKVAPRRGVCAERPKKKGYMQGDLDPEHKKLWSVFQPTFISYYACLGPDQLKHPFDNDDLVKHVQTVCKHVYGSQSRYLKKIGPNEPVYENVRSRLFSLYIDVSSHNGLC
ncbi:unnamed protein product [Peniophora sp. CBMAI 1063]|nr:unnamed protein product [Peniophora sp. CBMAI 1063]